MAALGFAVMLETPSGLSASRRIEPDEAVAGCGAGADLRLPTGFNGVEFTGSAAPFGSVAKSIIDGDKSEYRKELASSGHNTFQRIHLCTTPDELKSA